MSNLKSIHLQKLLMNFQTPRHFWLQLLILTFALCFHGSQSSNCGGVLEAARGTVEHFPDGNSQRCLWIIKLPASSSAVRFHLKKMPAFSQLSLYPQEGQVAGQITVRPISLTSANESVSLTTNSPNMVVVWAMAEGFNGQTELTFKWDGAQRQGQGQFEESDFVGGVSFVEGRRGKFTWEGAGESQQTLLWVLNSESPEDSVELTAVTNFEECDLIDLCLCCYLGIYRIYDNFMREVTTECGRSSRSTFSNLQGPLLALGFVNPEFKGNESFVSLSWSSDQKNETTTAKPPKTCSSGRPKSCSEVEENSGSNSEICVIYPSGPDGEPVGVLCDFETDGGGWTVIQKRSSGPKEEFYQNWTEYEAGFGSVEKNFWVGLKAIHALTKNLDQELRIDLWDFEGGQAYEKYANFSIADSLDFYRLNIGGYSGTAGDSMTSYHNLNGMRFTTKDKDNDEWGYNCAVQNSKGGWWHKSCTYSNLNGLYYEKGEATVQGGPGINWYSWEESWRSLRQVEMKIRNRV